MHKISIIIAAYNIEDYIERCMSSVVNQTYSNLDIVVVNDGSTDNTLNIINSFSENDVRINVINQSNKGLLASRKIGFNHSQGDYILFIDGDDWLEEDAIEIMYNAMVNDNCDIIQCKYYKRYDNGKTVKFIEKNRGIIDPDRLIEGVLLCDINHNVWTKLIRKDYIIENNIYFMDNITFGEDLAFTFELFKSRPKVKIIDDALYNYYQRSDSLTNSFSPKVLEINKVVQYIEKELIGLGLYENYRTQFEYFAYRHCYRMYRNFIFYTKNEIGDKLLKEWKNYNIKISMNKYYKENIGLKEKISNYFYSNSFLSYPFAHIDRKTQDFKKTVKSFIKY